MLKNSKYWKMSFFISNSDSSCLLFPNHKGKVIGFINAGVGLSSTGEQNIHKTVNVDDF